jgi:F-type H+-transporting ATPase subunit epsilon
MPGLQCTVVTPEKTLVDERIAFVALPLEDGEMGIAPGHSPLIARLGAGELRLIRSGSVRRYYVEGGFVEVLAGVVCLITSRAIRAEDLDEPVVEARLAVARARPANTPELRAARDRAVAALREQLRVARRLRESSVASSTEIGDF